MLVTLIMVPPGGGEADYQLDFELPAVPRPGEYVTIAREDRGYGYECFFVRSVWWDLSYPSSKLMAVEGQKAGKVAAIAVECEFARGPHMTPEHERACEAYRARGFEVREMDATMY